MLQNRFATFLSPLFPSFKICFCSLEFGTLDCDSRPCGAAHSPLPHRRDRGGTAGVHHAQKGRQGARLPLPLRTGVPTISHTGVPAASETRLRSRNTRRRRARRGPCPIGDLTISPYCRRLKTPGQRPEQTAPAAASPMPRPSQWALHNPSAGCTSTRFLIIVPHPDRHATIL